MSMFTLAISYLTTCNLPWFMDLTFQVPMQYCSLQHQSLLPSPVTSTTGCSFCFGSISSFFLELFLRWSPVAYWAPIDLGSSSFSVLSVFLLILFMGFLRWEYWSVPFLLLDLRPNYAGGNEDNVDPLQKVPCMPCYTQCSQPWSRPPPTHISSGDPWTLMGMSGSSLVGSLPLSSGSWCTQDFVCALQESVAPVLCKFWCFYGGVNGDLL